MKQKQKNNFGELVSAFAREVETLRNPRKRRETELIDMAIEVVTQELCLSELDKRRLKIRVYAEWSKHKGNKNRNLRDIKDNKSRVNRNENT